MLVIGDVHGKINEYKTIIDREKAKKSVQLGDFGFKSQHDWFLENVDCDNNKILFGNHDYYPYLDKPHSMCSTSCNDSENGIYYIRGAYSIDWKARTFGVDWFHNEEVSYRECEVVIEHCYKSRPNIIISHDCPHSIAHLLFALPTEIHTRTGHMLDMIFQYWQPELWIFGHYHRSLTKRIGKTVFHCLNELEYCYV